MIGLIGWRMTMSQNVGVEPKQYAAVHCSPEVLVEALTPAIDVEVMKAMLESARADAFEKPRKDK